MLAAEVHRPRGHRRRRPRTVQEWAATLAVCVVLAWVTCGLVMAMRLFGGWGTQPRALAMSKDGAAARAAAGDQPAGRRGLALHTRGGAAEQPVGLRAVDASTAQPQPLAAQQQQAGTGGGGLGEEPPRLSSWGASQLSQAELHGGWNLTWEAYDAATRHPNATVLSWSSPRLVLIKDFLAPGEVEHLVRQASGGFERSQVVADEQRMHSARTSSGSWLNGAKRDDVVRDVQRRIHQLVGIPEAFGESLYVLQYQAGQKYDAHTDHCASSPDAAAAQSCRDFLKRAGGPKCGPGGGGVTCGDRLATFIMYLRSPQEGGATVFPLATGRAAAAHAGAGRQLNGVGQLSSTGSVPPAHCQAGADVLQVAPPPGSAVFFWDYVPAGSAWRPGDLAAPDPASLHGGCPVLAGTKVIATRWIRAAEFH